MRTKVTRLPIRYRTHQSIEAVPPHPGGNAVKPQSAPGDRVIDRDVFAKRREEDV